MTIVRTTTPGGEAIVILPEAEFERLRSLADDAEDARTLGSLLGTDDRDLLSESDLDALRSAPSLLAFRRSRRAVTVESLAHDSAVPAEVIARIERGEGAGERTIYERLAVALDIAVEDILPEAA